MKRTILSLVLGIALSSVGATATATSPISPEYQAVYCYPTGVYWQHQIAAYPDYYAATNAYWVANYGVNTSYCQ